MAVFTYESNPLMTGISQMFLHIGSGNENSESESRL